MSRAAANLDVEGRREAAALVIRPLRVLIAALLRALGSVGPGGSSLAGKIARRLPAALWARHPLVVARRLGLWFKLDLRDNVQRTLYFSGWYERRYLSLLASRLLRGDVFLDVGAHIGIHALYLARHLTRLGGGSVIAFEPAPDLAERLRWAIARNDLENVFVQQEALGSSRSTETLRTDPGRYHESDGSVRSFYGPGVGAFEVKVTTFDDWMKDHPTKPSVVKVDVEGAELAVLQGMKQTLAEDPPRLIGVEIRDYLLAQAGVSRGAVPAFLQERGFELIKSPDLEGNFLFGKASIAVEPAVSPSTRPAGDARRREARLG